MDDALLVRRFEGLGDLSRDRQRLGDRDRPARDALREIVALDELHHQRGDVVGLLQPVDRADVGMVERGEHPRFAFEAGQPIGIVLERTRQDFDRDLAPQPRIARAVDLAHPPDAQQPLDLEDANAPSREQHARRRDEPGHEARPTARRSGRPPAAPASDSTSRRSVGSSAHACARHASRSADGRSRAS